MKKTTSILALFLFAACATTPAPVVSSPPADAPDIVLPAEGAAAPLSVVRIGHATVLLDFDGEFVLADPWFTESSQYHHGEPLGMSLSSLPKLSAVLVSHEHYDHFDIDAFSAYPDKDVPFFVVPGIADKARKAGFRNVRELQAWQSATTGSLTITAAPGEHSVAEVTYVLAGKGRTVYFAGDTKLIAALDELPRRFPKIDLALLPVNGLKVFGKEVVMSADEAAQLTRALRPRVAVPMHYAYHGGRIKEAVILSYNGTAERYVAEATKLAPETQVRILSPGQRLRIR